MNATATPPLAPTPPGSSGWAAGTELPSADVLDDDRRVGAVLSPLRRDILRRLAAEPDSAAGLAKKLAVPRQKLSYHLRELEKSGFLELAEAVQKRGCTERRMRVTARGWVLGPRLLGELAADPEAIADRFSSAYLVALASRLVGEVSSLRRRADAVGKRLATLSLSTEISFASAEDRAAFAEELTEAVARLTTKYHDETSPGSRRHRLVLAAHPAPSEGASEAVPDRPEESAE